MSIFAKLFSVETLIQKKCRLASLKKELEVLWKFEKLDNYLLGNKSEIIYLEKKITYLEEEINQEESRLQREYL